MAKERFYIYHGYRPVFEKLSDQQVKRLIIAMCDYDSMEKEPDFSDDSILEIGSTLIFNQMRVDLNKYKKKVDVAHDNGIKGGAPEGNQNARKNDPNQPNGLKLTDSVDFEPKQPKSGEKENEKVKENGKENGKGFLTPPNDLTFRVIEYFNQVAGTSFDVNDDEYKYLVQEHVKKGHSFEQMQRVIDRKVAEWSDPSNTNDMSSNINPLTVLNPKKFDTYLNAPMSKEEDKQQHDDYRKKALEQKIYDIKSKMGMMELKLGDEARKDDNYLVLSNLLDKYENQLEKALCI